MAYARKKAAAEEVLKAKVHLAKMRVEKESRKLEHTLAVAEEQAAATYVSAAEEVQAVVTDPAVASAVAHLSAEFPGGEVEEASSIMAAKCLQKQNATEMLCAAEKEEALAELAMDAASAAKTKADSEELELFVEAKAKELLAAEVGRAAIESKVTAVNVACKARSERGCTATVGALKYTTQVAEAEGLAVRRRWKAIEADLKEHHAASSTAALAAENAAYIEEEANAARLDAARAVVEAETAEEAARLDAVRKAAVALKMSQRAAQAAHTSQSAEADEDAAVAHADAQAAEHLAHMRGDAKSAAVAMAAAAEAAYVEAKSQAAAKHRAAQKAKMEELAAGSEGKQVADAAMRAETDGVHQAVQLLLTEAEASGEARYMAFLADKQQVAEAARLSSERAAGTLARKEVQMTWARDELKMAEVALASAAKQERALSEPALTKGMEQSAVVSAQVSALNDAKAKSAAVLRISMPLRYSKNVDAWVAMKDSLTEAKSARDGPMRESASVAVCLAGALESKTALAEARLAHEAYSEAIKETRTTVSIYQAQHAAAQKALTNAKEREKKAMEELLAGMDPQAKAAVVKEASIDPSSGGAGGGSYVNMVKARMAYYAKRAEDLNKMADQIAANAARAQTDLATAEKNLESAVVESKAQAGECAAAAKAEAAAMAELIARQQAVKDAVKMLNEAELTKKKRQQEVEDCHAAEKEAAHSTLPLLPKKKARLAEALAEAQEALTSISDTVTGLLQRKTEQEGLLRQAETRHREAKMRTETEEVEKKMAAQTKEYNMKVTVKAAAEQARNLEKLARAAKKNAEQALLDSNLHSMEMQLTEEARAESYQMMEKADAAMLAMAEAQAKARLALAKARTAEETALNAGKLEAKYKIGSSS